MKGLTIFALALSLGCGGHTTAPESGPSVVGIWELETINGEPLPAAANGAGTSRAAALEMLKR